MASINSTRFRRSRWIEGEHFVWVTGAALAITLIMTIILILVVLVNGLGVLWPSTLVLATLKDDTRVLGALVQHQEATQNTPDRVQFRTGNRDVYGFDFLWVNSGQITSVDYPADALVLERQEYGNFHGFITSVSNAPANSDLFQSLSQAWTELQAESRKVSKLNKQIRDLSREAEAIRIKQLKRDSNSFDANQQSLKERIDSTQAEKDNTAAALRQHTATFVACNGEEKVIPLIDIVRFYRPNAMSAVSKSVFYLDKLRELLISEPRESNTEGGLFPAIFGTVMLIFLMSLFSFPFGVLTGIFLREYAVEGVLVRIVRIAVNNLAGIPSIVYGIFGLGFFVYGVGGGIDRMFFSERLPTPTFGSGGILWASLTLGLLTAPVVIVATEEALGAIPRGVREASLALGATRFQTLTRLLLPMASPGIMTGFILAMARAAGEVAPLMITGVVKLAPALPVDGDFPFVHLDRKFMHLGFHIFDIGFQSPNVEASKPMVYVTTLLLVIIVLCMSSVAIRLRTKMKKRYTTTAM